MTQVTNPLPATLTRSQNTVIKRLLTAEDTIDGIIRYLRTLATATPAEVAEVQTALDEAIASSEGRHTAVMKEVRKLLDQPPVEFPDLSGLQHDTKANTDAVASLSERLKALEEANADDVPATELEPIKERLTALEGVDGTDLTALAERVAALENAPTPTIPEVDLSPLIDRLDAVEEALGLGSLDGGLDGGGEMPSSGEADALLGDIEVTEDAGFEDSSLAQESELLGTPLPNDFPGREALLSDGTYTTVEAVNAASNADLEAVKGIGPSTLENIRNYAAPTDTEVITNE